VTEINILFHMDKYNAEIEKGTQINIQCQNGIMYHKFSLQQFTLNQHQYAMCSAVQFTNVSYKSSASSFRVEEKAMARSRGSGTGSTQPHEYN
jgi:hypothetical protein